MNTMMWAGVASGFGGAAVITIYTYANYRLRRRGPAAVWFGGWLIGGLGMSLIGLGWALLGLAGPHFRIPALRIFGIVLSLAAGFLYFYSAARVGRLRSRSRYDLGLYREGLYRFIRHPQALALCILAVGVGLTTLSRPFLYGVPLWIGFWVGYTYFEERLELIPAYGYEYLKYMKSTGRLLPRFGTLLAIARLKAVRARATE